MDSSTVDRAWDSSTVDRAAGAPPRRSRRGLGCALGADSAADSAVTAGKWTAVHLHSAYATVQGGVVIDLTTLDLADATTWAEYGGATTDGDTITVYKAVDDQLDAGHSHRLTRYPIGETVTAPDWIANDQCGHGLHFGITPRHAQRYFTAATRFLEVTIDATEAVGLGDKIKAKSCTVVREVTIDGKAVTS